MKTIEERFWEKVDIQGEDDCWEWLAYTDKAGYGNFDLSGRTQYSHRVAYYLTYEDDMKGLLVCHTCDFPSCVNPDHLFLGTHANNSRDMVEKGRSASQRGEDSGRAKLSNDEMDKVHEMANSGNYTQQEIADMYGISRKTVYRHKTNRYPLELP